MNSKNTPWFHFLCLKMTLLFSSWVQASGHPSMLTPKLNLSKEWKIVSPGQGSICARGGEFKYFYFEGTDAKKLVIDFVGGGACWNEITCNKETATFSDNVDHLITMEENGELNGVYDRSVKDNPLKKWNYMAIPYCSGDIHWGDSVVTYGTGKDAFTIHHKGAVNVKASLNSAKKVFPHVEEIFITGTSAGGYASIYWTPAIKRMFPNAQIVQMSDSASGVITKDFFKNSFTKWNAVKHAPAWVLGIDPSEVDWLKLNITDLYIAIAKFHPEIKFSQFTTHMDDVQIFFFEIMGGEGEEYWYNQNLKNIERILNSTPNFSYYLAFGREHTILPMDFFYTLESDKVPFSRWLEDFVNHRSPENVECEKCKLQKF